MDLAAHDYARCPACMCHANGGDLALTAQNDRHTTAKWAGLLGSSDLAALQATVFEVIDHGAPIALTGLHAAATGGRMPACAGRPD